MIIILLTGVSDGCLLGPFPRSHFSFLLVGGQENESANTRRLSIYVSE
jgi:hypothetical protein